MKKTIKILLVVVAIIAFSVLVTFVLLYNNGLSGLHKHTDAQEEQIKVACVGDSITYGHGISGWENNNYPAKLQEILGEKYHVQNFGHSGRTLSPDGDQPYTESEQYRLSLEYNPDIIVLMLGSNDSKPENWVDIDTFIHHLDNLIDTYREANPKVKIYLCTPANAFFSGDKNSGTTNYDIQPKIVDDISTAIKAYALTHMNKITNVIDIHDLTEYRADWFAKDNVHPSNEGAAAIAEEVAKKIKSKINNIIPH